MSLRAGNLRFGYKGSPLFEGLSFEAAPGELLCLLGPNASGKSSLLRALTGMSPLSGGSLSWMGRDLGGLGRRERARIMAYVPQHVPLAPISVYDAIMLGRTPYLRFFPSAGDRLAVERSLARMGLSGLRQRSLDELSGGERQKVMLGLALAQDCPVLILDEAASGLDLRYQLEVYALLREECSAGGRLVIAAEHDLNLAARYADRLLLMAGRRILAQGPPAEVLNVSLLREAYGVEAELESHEGRVRLRDVALPADTAKTC